MYKRKKIVRFLDDYLEAYEIYDPYYDNGLIIEGKDKVAKVLLAYAPTRHVISYAYKKGYDLLLTHYGMFYKNAHLRINSNIKKKLMRLMESNLNHYVAYLPLDVHEEIGSNVQIIRSLDADFVGTLSRDEVEAMFIANFYENVKFAEMVESLKASLSERVIGMNFGSKHVNAFLVVSTYVKDVVYDALDYDALITTSLEPALYNEAKEYGLNLIYLHEQDVKHLALSLLKYKLMTSFPLLDIDVMAPSKEEELIEFHSFTRKQ